ncbi:MAG: MATE family efflux transporter [Acetatifactor sp.]|nr:MATE family efflux transporter [Acetatifactor sp.]
MTEEKKGLLSKFLVTDVSFYKKAMLIIIPVLLQNMINQGVNMMDTIMVGQLGEVSISASSLANQFYVIFTFICMGVSAAGLVLASQYWGAEDYKTVHKVFDLILQLIIIVGALMAVVTALFPQQIMSMYTDDVDVITEGGRYLRITALIYVPHGISLVISNVIRSTGNARLGLVVSIVSFFVNIFCNYVFIFGKLGLPAMGVMGAALGTLAARVVELMVTVVYMWKFEKNLRYHVKGLIKLPTRALLSEFKRLGLPAVISDTILALAASAISMILGHMGREVVSAYAIVAVLERLCTVATLGIASAASVMIGQTVGAGKFEQARREGYTFLSMSCVIGVIAMIIVHIAGVWSIGLYEITEDTVSVAVSMVSASAILVFFQAVQSALSKGILRGGGDTKFLMVADVIFQWCASIPLGYLAGIVLGWTPFWVLIMLRIDYVIKSVWLVFRLTGDKWIHKAKTM